MRFGGTRPALIGRSTALVKRSALPALFAAVLGAAALTSAPAGAAPVLMETACPSSQYENVQGNCVQRPTESDTAPNGATARCGDGTYSFSRNHRGTCSHHGGVSKWL
ncbi:DUF3761 domain-containing protein [Nocardia sp. NBC_01503]|uniref:DUF3761 domain-containing protein n=1 Tax=Nocardia sp. NBC_01503 TaxID=2975997 RepID=UPI002E7C2EA6|nr:DUF3761 domain-containing protein [Nocardia sp. NBC_01503]WTL32249.1 DUF3761 domain-containing protein [Nocardia sp. NBC_01503]